MKAENAILGLLGITIVAGIGFSIYKKTKANPLAQGANPGGANPDGVSRSANGITPGTVRTPDVRSTHLKTASTRNSIFEPAGANPTPSGKVRWVEGGIVYEGSKDRKTKKAVGEA